jgi:hypothetical protein
MEGAKKRSKVQALLDKLERNKLTREGREVKFNIRTKCRAIERIK